MLEWILGFSIRRRHLVVFLTLGAAFIGAMALHRLPIDAVPDITNNQVQINTLHAAFAPEEMEKLITFPIEFSLAGIPGLESTRSLSRNGFSQVTAVFEDDVDIYFARQQVMERLTLAREALPEGADPQMGPISTGLSEIYMYIVEYAPFAPEGAADGETGWQPDGSYLTPGGERLVAENEKAAWLREVQDWIIAPQLRTVKGVAGVDSIGGHEKQYAVQPDPTRLMAHGFSLGDLLEALERNNRAVGASYIEDRGEQYIVRADGRVRTAEEIGDIVIGSHEGVAIRVRDVATVQIGRELRSGAASENGREVVVGTALMLIGANSRTVAAAVDEKMNEIRRSLPDGVEARTVLDRSELVEGTVATVRTNLIEGALLVIVILFLLLGNIRAAVITALAIPLSMLLAAIGMVQSGISGNLMSLGAIDFGLIVDGAVIIVENCVRMLGERRRLLGRPLTLRERLQTVFVASKEVRQATAFGEAIIIIVYLPVLTLTGIEGKMFRPMALTVVFALVGAFVLSLTFVPAMVALFVTGKGRERENILMRGAKWLYRPVLGVALRFRWLVVAGAVVMLLGSVALFSRLGQEFLPRLDEGHLAIQIPRIASTSITQAQEMQFLAEKTISRFPEVALVFSKTGTAEVASDPMPPNVSDTFVILKPRSEWPDPREPKDSLVERIDAALLALPGQRYVFTQPVEMRTNELIAGVRGDVVVKVFGDDFEELYEVSNSIARELEQIPGAADVRIETIQGLPFLNIRVRREAVARYGLDVSDVQDVVAVAIGGREAGVVFQGDRRFDIVVRLPEPLRASLDTIRSLPVPVPAHEDHDVADQAVLGGGRLEAPRFVPLEGVADIEITEGPNQVSRENGRRRTYAAANVRGRDLGSFVAEARQRIAETVALPPGYSLDWGGQYENLVRARQRLAVIVPVCFVLIFVMLFTTFNSLKYAALVFVAVPLALPGGVLSLWVRGIPFSISAAVGLIAVSGVAVLDGLVMVSYVNQLRRGGMALEAAIREGALTRLRPVLMTSLVASLGFLPMALATGRGAEVQRPLATVVIGGLVTSTLLTLVVLPSLYRMVHRKDEVLEPEEEADLASDPMRTSTEANPEWVSGAVASKARGHST